MYITLNGVLVATDDDNNIIRYNERRVGSSSSLAFTVSPHILIYHGICISHTKFASNGHIIAKTIDNCCSSFLWARDVDDEVQLLRE